MYFWSIRLRILGYKIGKGGVKPEDSKIQAIMQVEIPKTKKDVRAIFRYDDLFQTTCMLQLRNLTKKHTPNHVLWNDQADNSFN